MLSNPSCMCFYITPPSLPHKIDIIFKPAICMNNLTIEAPYKITKMGIKQKTTGIKGAAPSSPGYFQDLYNHPSTLLPGPLPSTPHCSFQNPYLPTSRHARSTLEPCTHRYHKSLIVDCPDYRLDHSHSWLTQQTLTLHTASVHTDKTFFTNIHQFSQRSRPLQSSAHKVIGSLYKNKPVQRWTPYGHPEHEIIDSGQGYGKCGYQSKSLIWCSHKSPSSSLTANLRFPLFPTSQPPQKTFYVYVILFVAQIVCSIIFPNHEI